MRRVLMRSAISTYRLVLVEKVSLILLLGWVFRRFGYGRKQRPWIIGLTHATALPQ